MWIRKKGKFYEGTKEVIPQNTFGVSNQIISWFAIAMIGENVNKNHH